MKFKWNKLEKPIFALAPMEGATDTVFRQIVIDSGKPDVTFTEFTNVEGLLSKGGKEVGRRLMFEEKERPIIAQIWGLDPNSYESVARNLSKQGFDGIDINMGCPERKVVNSGACSALIENHKLAAEIIEAVKRGAPDLPISVKTRIGLKSIQTEEWISFLLEQNIDALIIHFRTQKEMSLVPAHWEEAEKVVRLKNSISPSTVILGNGDIMTKSQGADLANKYALDGVMIGRGVFKNPYFFDENIDYHGQNPQERIKLLQKHLDLFKRTWLKTHPLSEKDYRKSYPPLKRFFKIYISGFDGAAEFREKLMLTRNIEEVEEVLAKIKA